jgi:hypothetical protein
MRCPKEIYTEVANGANQKLLTSFGGAEAISFAENMNKEGACEKEGFEKSYEGNSFGLALVKSQHICEAT